MRSLFFCATLLALCPLRLIAQAPDTLWTKKYGGIGNEHGASVHQLSDGGYVIGAETESFGAGDYDIWFIRTDANGDTLWTRTYGGPGEERCRAFQPTYDGGYIATGSRRPEQASVRIYVVRTDSIGDTLWTREYGPKSVSYSIQQTSDSGYIIAGSVFFGSNEDIYLIRINSFGDTLWTKRYGGTSGDWAWSVAQTIDGGYIVGGSTGSSGAGSYDIWLLKLDENGEKRESLAWLLL